MGRYILLLGVFLSFCVQVFSADVHVRGYNFSSSDGNITIQKETAVNEFNQEVEKIVQIDQEGFFEVTLQISKPEFWSVEGASLFLVPGENLDITFDKGTHIYSFKGKTMDECTFLSANRNNIYVDLSFLDGGKNVRESFEETKKVIDAIGAEKLSALTQTAGLDENFVKIQINSIKAHWVNSYLNYYMFSKDYEQDGMGNEYKTESGRKFIESIRELVEPVIKDVVADSYIDLFDIRWVVDRCMKDGLTSFPEKSIWVELYTVKSFLKKFQDGVSSELISEARERLATLTREDFALILKPAIEKVEILQSGKPAIDLRLEDVDGKEVNLSDYKGKLIYLDFWATWCGPCKKEYPFFIKLKEKYEDVIFISISTDRKRESWLKAMQRKEKTDVLQYHASRENTLSQLIEWNISLIPRFILIDKDFNIVDAFAPRPSDEGIEPLLNKLLN
ncbi:TlpA disulfide reductase family protein [Labilibaculum manganireducens]|uniref:TlpA family protein disulfide reductase n=1 Tax=Labilibaculum manganireducens TaxID=1940525 RepID=UPI0029F55C9E|nr:TlpA disulfide reductase family protein [Labilibaculum manganireducens]